MYREADIVRPIENWTNIYQWIMILFSSSIELQTQGSTDIHDITPLVARKVTESGFDEGVAFISVVGSTASLTTIEYEPALVSDFKEFVERLIPSNIPYAHDQTWGDANGHSHLRASLIGNTQTVPITQSKLELGTWQQVILIDFDTRPRVRKIVVKILGRKKQSQ